MMGMKEKSGCNHGNKISGECLNGYDNNNNNNNTAAAANTTTTNTNTNNNNNNTTSPLHRDDLQIL